MPRTVTHSYKSFSDTPLTIHFRKDLFMLSKDFPVDPSNRLIFIKGEIEETNRIVEAGKDPNPISNLSKAAGQARQKAHFLLLEEMFPKSFSLR